MSLTVDANAKTSQAGKVQQTETKKTENVSIHTNNTSKPQTANSRIEQYKAIIQLKNEKKKELLARIKNNDYTDDQKMSAATKKHPIAAGIAGAGMVASAGGFFAAACFIPVGLAVGLGGGLVAGGALGYIRYQTKNLTSEDMKKYIQSQINDIDKDIAYYQKLINKLTVK